MAASKRRKKNNNKLHAELHELFNKLNLGLLAAYFLLRILFGWSSFFWYHWLGFILLVSVSFIASGQLLAMVSTGGKDAQETMPYRYIQDVLWINWFVMGASIFSDKVWYVYLVVPVYAVYKLVTVFCGKGGPAAAMGLPGAGQADQMAQMQQMQQMQQQQQARPGFRRARGQRG